MTVERHYSHLWRKLESRDYSPTWYNVPDRVRAVSYQGDDARLVCDEEAVRLVISNLWTRPFIVCFAACFLPFFAWIGISYVTGPTKWVFVIGGPSVGGFTCAFVYWLESAHAQAGDYFVWHHQSGEVELPRQQVRFGLDQVVGFQWVCGRSRMSSERRTDLNLVVRDGDGTLRRYFVMGSPNRRMVEEIVGLTNIPIDEFDLGSTYREADLRQMTPVG